MLTRYGDAPQPARWSFGSILKVGLGPDALHWRKSRCMTSVQGTWTPHSR